MASEFLYWCHFKISPVGKALRLGYSFLGPVVFIHIKGSFCKNGFNYGVHELVVAQVKPARGWFASLAQGRSVLLLGSSLALPGSNSLLPIMFELDTGQ